MINIWKSEVCFLLLMAREVVNDKTEALVRHPFSESAFDISANFGIMCGHYVCFSKKAFSSQVNIEPD